MTTLSEAMTHLKENGYTIDFTVDETGLIATEGSDKHYQPDEITVGNFYRFEGASDPGDMSILYAIETKDGTKGTLSDSFGPEADPDVAPFMALVTDMKKEKNFTQSVNDKEDLS
ncbi:MAG: hypothetical protein V4616_04905 [Bacteroidota bacterium]